MLLNAYSLYDRKSLQYHAPFFAVADGAALRMVTDLVADPNTTVGRHPEDYVLYRVGAWDDASGSLLPVTALDHISDCSALVRRGRNITPFALDGEGSDHQLTNGSLNL